MITDTKEPTLLADTQPHLGLGTVLHAVIDRDPHSATC